MKYLQIALLALLTFPGLAQARAELSTEMTSKPDVVEPPDGIQEYQQAIERDGYSARRLYQLAHVQRSAGKLGAAIANLQRASVLAPRNAPIRDALKEAREEAGVSLPTQSWYASAATFISPQEWSIVGTSAVLVLSLAIFLLAYTPKRRRQLLPIAALSLLMATVAFTGWRLASAPLDSAIVVANAAAAKQSPFAQAETLFSLQEGEAILIRQHSGNYDYIETGSGSRGWVDSDDIIELVGKSHG